MTTTAPQKLSPTDPIIQELLAAFDNLDGLHPGFRAAHAKGVMCSGIFEPAAGATELTRAPHVTSAVDAGGRAVLRILRACRRSPTTIRTAPVRAALRSVSNLADHVHTDVIGHSADGFPASNAEEFLGFLRAAAASGPEAPNPTPIEQFLAAHPTAMDFVLTPKPIPTSFAPRVVFLACAAYRFTNSRRV